MVASFDRVAELIVEDVFASTQLKIYLFLYCTCTIMIKYPDVELASYVFTLFLCWYHCDMGRNINMAIFGLHGFFVCYSFIKRGR